MFVWAELQRNGVDSNPHQHEPIFAPPKMPIPSLATSLKRRAPASAGKDASAVKVSAPCAPVHPFPEQQHQQPLQTSRGPPPEGTAAASSNAAHTLKYGARPTSSHSITGDGQPKRSLLPQPGDSRYAPRRTPLTDAGRARAVTGAAVPASTQRETPQLGRARPRSMYQTVTSAREDDSSDKAETSSIRSVRTVGASARSAVTENIGLGRAASLRKPLPPVPTQASQRSHVRTQSTSTASGTPAATITTAPKERPKSLFLGRSASVKVSMSSPVESTNTGSGSSTRLAALRRAASVRTKPEATTPTEPHAPSKRSGTAPATKSTHKDETTKHAKPAFSTLQQHFTPKKIGKALTSTFLHPSAPDVGTDAIPADLVTVQAELLQLHLLHQAAAPTMRQWEHSAYSALEHRFEHVKSLHRVLRGEERHGQEQKNVRALCDWSSGSASFGFAEHVQILSGPLQELPSLVDPGGRFQRLVLDFERWIARVEEIWAAREQLQGGQQIGGSSALDSAEAMGDAWKAETATLVRKLTGFSRDLSRLTDPAPGSSIACVVQACQQLVDGLLQELYTVQKIEADVVEREKEWVEVRLRAIARDAGVHLGRGEEREAWRS